MRATARDLRFHCTELLNTVKRGEEVIITYRGKACAKLIPIEEDIERPNSPDELFGIWKNNEQTEGVEKYVRNLRKGRFSAD